MATNRQAVLKSRVLRYLVSNGADKRQMVRQLSRVDKPELRFRTLGGAFVWQETPQGQTYWYTVAKLIGEYT